MVSVKPLVLMLLLTIGLAIECLGACPALRSPRDRHLQHVAQAYANFMARHQTQSYRGEGHYQFYKRTTWLAQRIGPAAYEEITAESWDWNANADAQTLWADAAASWRGTYQGPRDPGHWKVAGRSHQAIGAAMAQGQNGIWYFCIISRD